MAKATTNNTDISYVVQSVAGSTPASPTFQIVPTIGGSPNADISTEVSAIIRSDRQIDDLVPVDADIGGDIEIEIAYAPFKPLIAQLIRQDTPVTINHTGTVDASNSGSTFTDAGATFVTDGVLVGHYLDINGYVDTTINRVYKVTAVTETVLTVSPAPAADESGTGNETVKGVIYRNGSDAPKLNTFCKRVDQSTDSFFYYVDTLINSMTFNFATGAILTGTMNVMGTTESATTTAISGQTFSDPPSYVIMNSVDNVMEVGVGGLPSTTCFQSMELTVSNSAEAAKCIGTLGAVENQDFTWEIMASIETYFENLTLYNYFKDSTSFAVHVWLEDSSGNEMVISMPVCKFEELDVPIGGKDEFLTMPGSFRALRDQTNDYTIQIAFFDA